MSGRFPYFNKQTGKTEMRPVEPSYLDKVVENVTDSVDIDKQRKAYVTGQANINSPDKSPYMPEK